MVTRFVGRVHKRLYFEHSELFVFSQVKGERFLTVDGEK